MPASRSSPFTGLAAPENASTGANTGSRSASTSRPDRTGPIASGSSEWNSARNRVRPPSTSSSNTMSAASSPSGGSAAEALSILTARIGWSISSSSSSPVRTATGGGSVGLGASDGSLAVSVGSGWASLVQPATSSTSTASAQSNRGTTKLLTTDRGTGRLYRRRAPSPVSRDSQRATAALLERAQRARVNCSAAPAGT